MNSSRIRKSYRYILRLLAIVFACAIVLGVVLIARGIVANRGTSPYQSWPGIASSIVALLSLAGRGLLLKGKEETDLKEFTRRINRSRLRFIREEISAALFHHRKPPIDIRLTLLKGSMSEPPKRLMKFTTIGELFAGIPYGRMLVVGLPGSGKSLLALQFTFQASSAEGDDPCIPVVIPAQSWDLRMPSLDYWLTRQAANLLDIDKSLAWSLIKQDILLPVIDGLDEMDSSLADPTNATCLVKSLNEWGGRFLATCRTDTWKSLSVSGIYLEDACEVQLEPLTVKQATDYLEERNQRYGQKSIPFDIIRDISRIFGSMLSTPFDLALIGSLLDRRGSIKDLMGRIEGGMAEREIEAELLTAFIEARAHWYPMHAGHDHRSITHYRREESRRYSVANVIKWSRSLAVFLQETGGREILDTKMSTTAISIDRLWPIAGLRAPRIVDQGITIVLWAPLLVFLSVLMKSRGYHVEVTLVIIGSVMILPLSSMWANRSWVHPSKIVFRRILQPKRLFRLCVGLSLAMIIVEIGSPGIRMAFAAYYGGAFAISFALGIATSVRDSINLPALAGTGFIIGLIGMVLTRIAVVPTGDPMLSLASGMTGGATSLVIGVKVGIYVAERRGNGGLDLIPAGLPTPLARLQGDFQAGIIAGLLAVAMGLVICFINKWPVNSIWEIITLCLLAGVAAGPGYAAATWRRHVAMLVCARGKLPFRIARFFTWAHSAGLLRIAGRSYEFRHRRIQDWLVQ